MATPYVQAIRKIQKHREMARSMANDMTIAPQVRAHYEGQVQAYDSAIREIHETFEPDVEFDPTLYQDRPERPLQPR
jgi:hypothetical protein